jgi:hypothetical protein
MAIEKQDIKSRAADLVKNEKNKWENSTVWVTDKVAFNMREVIKTCRKNYWGVFDKPTDPQTGRDKIFVPLTESIVEATVKNIDVDQKDIDFKAKKPNKLILSRLVKNYVKNKLDKQRFGEMLNDMERTLAIDGTAVWKIFKDFDVDGKRKPLIKKVDLLNFYIDPTANSIYEADSVIERSVMTPEEVKSMTDWIDTEDVEGIENVDKNNSFGSEVKSDNSSSNVNLVPVYERWGLMPKSLITGDEKDSVEQVQGRIVVSEGNNGTFKTHLIEENKEGRKPYEEAWLTRVPGRWYGRGQAEKVMFLQIYQNMIVNIRATRATVSQLGIFKIRKGSGITPEMMRKLAVNGALQVENMQDIEQFVMQEASTASYKDEEVAQNWAEKVTGAFEVVTGEKLPTTTTATVGAIQSRSAASGFQLIKEGIGMFIERALERHYIPLLGKNIKKGEMIRLVLDGEELREFDEMMADEAQERFIEEQKKQGRQVIFQEEVEEVREKTIEQLQKEGRDRFKEAMEDIDLTEYDLEVYVGNEKTDKNILVTDLINFSRIAPEFREPIANALNDILNLNLKLPKAPQAPIQGSQQAEASQAEPSAAQTPEQRLTQALTARAGI